MELKAKIVSSLVKGINYLFNVNNVTLVKGTGKLIDKNSVAVIKDDGSTETIATDKVILATGSVAIVPGMFHFDGEKVISSDGVLDLQEQPKSMIIVGGWCYRLQNWSIPEPNGNDNYHYRKG